MKIALAREMQEIDRRTIEEFGVPSLVLMERAALSAASLIMDRHRPQKTIVVAGPGNNGGDGFALARMLKCRGWHVKVHFLGDKKKASPDCKAQIQMASKFGVRAATGAPGQADLHAALVVDALFGTGLSKAVSGDTASAIEAVNRSGSKVIALDIPSGISADTGRVMGAAIRADVTVAFGLPKPGLLLHPGREHAGELVVADIGLAPGLLSDPSLRLELPDMEFMKTLVPERPVYSHKGTYGHVLCLMGSRGKTGAALLAARAALRAGAGLVTIGTPAEIAGSYYSLVTDEMTLPLPSREGILAPEAASAVLRFMHEKGDVLAAGPGLGVNPAMELIIKELALACAAPMVLDADALNALAGKPEILQEAKAPVVLTPHPGEMARLLGIPVKEVEEDRPAAARKLSTITGASVLLKGVPTLIAEPGGTVYFNNTGTPALAKAGTGDVLTGMLAAFISQGVSPVHAALLAAYVHGLAGEAAARTRGVHGVTASDLHEAVPTALKELASEDR